MADIVAKINGEVFKKENIGDLCCPQCGSSLDFSSELFSDGDGETCCGKLYVIKVHTVRIEISDDPEHVDEPETPANPDFTIKGCTNCRRTFDAALHPKFCPFCGTNHLGSTPETTDDTSDTEDDVNVDECPYCGDVTGDCFCGKDDDEDYDEDDSE
jgi:hypothetical protein